MTRLAVEAFDPAWVASVRAIGAALLGALALWVSGERLPARPHWPDLIGVVAGVVVGFPLFTSLAMQHTDASHGAIVVGLLPMATALAGALLNRERPSRGFWIAATLGTVLVAGFSLQQSQGHWGLGDGFLGLAVVFSAVGYACGGKLARSLGGWQTIAWGLVLALPLTTGPAIWLTLEQHARTGFAATGAQWFGLAYLTIMSQFIGFFAWYAGLARAGVARVSQVQLLQLFFTLVFSAWLLGERVEITTWLVGIGVLICVLGAKRAAVR